MTGGNELKPLAVDNFNRIDDATERRDHRRLPVLKADFKAINYVVTNTILNEPPERAELKFFMNNN